MRLVKFDTTIGEVWLNPKYVIAIEQHPTEPTLSIIYSSALRDDTTLLSWHTEQSPSATAYRMACGEDEQIGRAHV